MGYNRIVAGRPRRTKRTALVTRERLRSPCPGTTVSKSGDLIMSVATVLTDRFDRALLYATHVHGGQVRKETSIPYIAHLLAVAATVLEYGGSEDMAIAGLLHDAAEDQGGEPRLADIRNRFGDRVADIVHACSDSVVNTHPYHGGWYGLTPSRTGILLNLA